MRETHLRLLIFRFSISSLLRRRRNMSGGVARSETSLKCGSGSTGCLAFRHPFGFLPSFPVASFQRSESASVIGAAPSWPVVCRQYALLLTRTSAASSLFASFFFFSTGIKLRTQSVIKILKGSIDKVFPFSEAIPGCSSFLSFGKCDGLRVFLRDWLSTCFC